MTRQHPIGAFLRARRRELGMTIDALATAVGCARSYVSAIETGRRPPPSEGMLRRFERALYLEPGSLVARALWESVPEPIRAELIRARRSAGAGARLADLVRRCGGPLPQPLEDARRSGELDTLLRQIGEGGPGGEVGGSAGLPADIPVINRKGEGPPVRWAGASARVLVPDVADPDAYAMWLGDDAMSPEYRAGDLVVCSPGTPVHDGADCCVRAGGRAWFRRVFREGDAVRLAPLNPRHRAETVPRDQMESVHPCVLVIRSVR